VSRRGARFVFLALVVVAVGFGAAASRIYVKAWLAQRLLHRAWAATRTGGLQVKPWPWADTWPVARLAMPAQGIDLIVLADASGRSMAFGPGLVAGTAPPGAWGHTVLSGHRDTQFRFLRSLAPGDHLRLEDARGLWREYEVTDTLIVDAHAVEILRETDDARLTLVTCYPFDSLVPGGPLRYVVRAAALPVATHAARETSAARTAPRARMDPRDGSAAGPAAGRSLSPRA
jgi:sortase A